MSGNLSQQQESLTNAGLSLTYKTLPHPELYCQVKRSEGNEGIHWNNTRQGQQQTMRQSNPWARPWLTRCLYASFSLLG
jgi:hypothetical protein